jgi:hypothetical protein
MDSTRVVTSGILLVTICCLGAPVCLSQSADHVSPVEDMATAEDAGPVLGAGASLAVRQTDGNAVGLFLTNIGFFGDNFDDRDPSMEYPLGSEIDHLVRAGLWIGAITADDDTVVSTGTITGYFGRGFATASEFTQRTGIKERSTLVFRRSYCDTAVSEQDFITRYTDYPVKSWKMTEGNPDTLPLNVSILQQTYLWSYEFAEAFVIASFTVKNEDPQGRALTNMYLGLYAELASGWKGAYDTWPPSGWFYNKKLEYFPDLRMCGEHHYTYQNGRAPSWGAIAVLGTAGKDIPPIEDLKISFNWMNWGDVIDSIDARRFYDRNRYELISNGETDRAEDAVPREVDPVEIISAGPFTLAPAESVVFVCAFIGGMDRASLIENAEWAHKAFQNDYVLPSPPPPPRFKIKPARNRITMFWDSSPDTARDPFYKIPDFEGYRIYMTRKEGALGEDFDLVRELDVIDSMGYDTGFESVIDPRMWVDGDDTTYTDYSVDISNLKDGFKYWIAITSFDKGMPEEGVESMESGVKATQVLAIPGTGPDERDRTVCVFPNPYRGEAIWDGERDKEKYIWFANLPERATIRIYTLAGDLVKTIDFNADTYLAHDIEGLGTRQERDGFVAMPGGMCAWDLISDEEQAVATGLYIYSVEDRKTGRNQIGKFMIIR